MGYLCETHLKHISREVSFAYKSFYSCVARSLCNFAQSTAVILPCFVQNYKTIGQLKRMLWTRFEFKIRFGWISYIAQHPWIIWTIKTDIDFIVTINDHHGVNFLKKPKRWSCDSHICYYVGNTIVLFFAYFITLSILVCFPYVGYIWFVCLYSTLLHYM